LRLALVSTALVYRPQIVKLKTMPLENLHERIIAISLTEIDGYFRIADHPGVG
jgi:hypothetical protein